MMNGSAIKIENLEFSYGRNQVLSEVNLRVPTGAIFGFLGRNGAGKTTTIKLLLGLLSREYLPGVPIQRPSIYHNTKILCNSF